MLTDRFGEALTLAFTLHREQGRKISGIPYMAHLMSVSALVFENGGSEDLAIAGLLHDAVEDQGGMETHARITALFGEAVATTVLECSDSTGGPDKVAWRVRKEAYIADIPRKSDGAILVTACDKLHNSRSILTDLRSEGLSVFQRFKGGQDGTLWYYESLAKALEPRLAPALGQSLLETATALRATTEAL